MIHRLLKIALVASLLGFSLFSAATDSEKTVLSREQAIQLATNHLVKIGIDRKTINLDDARFDAEVNEWIVLFWESKGPHNIIGIMVKATDSINPTFEIVREDE